MAAPPIPEMSVPAALASSLAGRACCRRRPSPGRSSPRRGLSPCFQGATSS